LWREKRGRPASFALYREARVHDDRDGATDFLVESLTYTTFDRPQVADRDIGTALVGVKLQTEVRGCIPGFLLIHINRATNGEFVAPNTEPGVIFSALRKSPGRYVEVVARSDVGALEVSTEGRIGEHIRVGETSAQVKRVDLYAVLDERKPSADTNVRPKQLIVRHHTHENYVSGRS
jgi:hypothetical protein